MKNLSPTYKELIFKDPNINNDDAKLFLSSTPIVFAYLFPLYDQKILTAALQSNIVQDAISNSQTPLFFITNMHTTTDLPDALKMVARAGKIRIVTTWLPPAEFYNLNAIFMNHNTNSIIVPSGDNTLTACIKAGKFPLYAHKDLGLIDNDMSELPDFIKQMLRVSLSENKASMFKSMLKILLQDSQKYGWHNDPGLKYCMQILAYLGRNKSNIQLHKCINQEMLTFFRTKFAPYLMENYAFENRALPTLLKYIKTSPAHTVQYDAAKKKETEKPNSSAPSKATFAGFKPGFLS